MLKNIYILVMLAFVAHLTWVSIMFVNCLHSLNHLRFTVVPKESKYHPHLKIEKGKVCKR